VSYVFSKTSTAVHWIDTKMTCGALDWIGRNTFGRLYQLGNWIYDQFVPPKIVKDLSAGTTLLK
jgi:hypothetical protein